MRKIFVTTISLLILGLFTARAGEIKTFTVAPDALIVIAANEAPDQFDLDITQMKVKSADVLKTYCEAISSFVVTFTPDFDNQKIHVQLHNDKVPNGAVWGLKEWNDFFLSYQPKWYTYFTEINV